MLTCAKRTAVRRLQAALIACASVTARLAARTSVRFPDIRTRTPDWQPSPELYVLHRKAIELIFCPHALFLELGRPCAFDGTHEWSFALESGEFDLDGLDLLLQLVRRHLLHRGFPFSLVGLR